MLSVSCLSSHLGYPLFLNFFSRSSRVLVNSACDDVHLIVLMISPLRIVLKVAGGWQLL